jgi:hypothetical protein
MADKPTMFAITREELEGKQAIERDAPRKQAVPTGPAPRKNLGDQSRTDAFDPSKDDPSTRIAPPPAPASSAPARSTGYSNKAALGDERDRSYGVLSPPKGLGYAKGGMVKHGSPKVSAPCGDSKTVKCYK